MPHFVAAAAGTIDKGVVGGDGVVGAAAVWLVYGRFRHINTQNLAQQTGEVLRLGGGIVSRFQSAVTHTDV